MLQQSCYHGSMSAACLKHRYMYICIYIKLLYLYVYVVNAAVQSDHHRCHLPHTLSCIFMHIYVMPSMLFVHYDQWMFFLFFCLNLLTWQATYCLAANYPSTISLLAANYFDRCTFGYLKRVLGLAHHGCCLLH